MSLNQVVRFALSDAGATVADGVNLTNAEVAAKTEAGLNGLLVRGSVAVGGVCHDYSGNIYVTDTARHCILRIDEGGKISIFAGLPNTSGDLSDVTIKDNNDLNRAAFLNPRGIACDKSGTIFVADSGNNKIKVIRQGKINLVAGSSVGLTDGVGSAAQFRSPVDITVSNNGTLYVADYDNNALRKITESGDVLTIAGNGTAGDAENVVANGQTATFSNPKGVAVDAKENVYVLDTANNKIKKVVPEGHVYLFSGSGSSGRSLGSGSSSMFNCSYNDLLSCDVDESGNLYVLDLNTSNGSRLVKLDFDGRPSVIADFNATTHNDNVKGIICSPGQKIFVTITGAGVFPENSSSSSSSSIDSSSSSSSLSSGSSSSSSSSVDSSSSSSSS